MEAAFAHVCKDKQNLPCRRRRPANFSSNCMFHKLLLLSALVVVIDLLFMISAAHLTANFQLVQALQMVPLQ